MEKVILLFKLAYKFLQKFVREYFLLFAKYVLIILVGIAIIILVDTTPFLQKISILGCIVGLIIILYGIWKCTVVVYITNEVAIGFLKNKKDLSYKKCFLDFQKTKEKNFMLYVTFIGIVTLFADGVPLVVNSKFKLLELLVFIAILPIIIFYYQTYSLKKDDEKFSDLLCNCYLYLDKTALYLILANILVYILLSVSIIGIIFLFFFIPFFNAANVFWLFGRMEEMKIKSE